MADLQAIEDIFMSRLERFRPLPAMQEAIVKNADDILDINRRQLEQGEDAAGVDMGDYSNWYADYKGRKNPIDLKDTGSYHSNMYLEIDNKETRIRNRDQKEASLNKYVKKRTQGQPLGIKKENIPFMVAAVRPEFIADFKRTIGLP
jgi:hypothetical protein